MRCSAQKDAYCYRVLTGLLSPKIETLAITSMEKEWEKELAKDTEN
jgi:hypothetical protein